MGNLVDDAGKFIDDVLESDYQKYIQRKAKEGKVPKDRLEWKEARDYWLNDSPMDRGNAFNEIGRLKYKVNELHLADGKRLDSYVEGVEIISRKATDLENIQLSTFEKYLKEMHKKYAPGTVIRLNAFPKLDGKMLSSELVLEIPSSNKTFSRIQEYIDLAKDKYSIKIEYLEE